MKRDVFPILLLAVAGIAFARQASGAEVFERYRTYTVPSIEFVPNDQNTVITTEYPSLYRTVIAQVGAGFPRIFAPVHLPDGARVAGFEVDYCNRQTVGTVTGGLVGICKPDGLECDVIQGVAFGRAAEPAGTCNTALASYLPALPALDNDKKLYYFVFSFSGDCMNGCIAIRSVRIFYEMEAPPAPDVATFTDVPTSHPFFRFVEALHAAGGTAGCGNGKYCPNEPVTRGQIAVMLASLFGLGW